MTSLASLSLSLLLTKVTHAQYRKRFRASYNIPIEMTRTESSAALKLTRTTGTAAGFFLPKAFRRSSPTVSVIPGSRTIVVHSSTVPSWGSTNSLAESKKSTTWWNPLCKGGLALAIFKRASDDDRDWMITRAAERSARNQKKKRERSLPKACKTLHNWFCSFWVDGIWNWKWWTPSERSQTNNLLKTLEMQAGTAKKA